MAKEEITYAPFDIKFKIGDEVYIIDTHTNSYHSVQRVKINAIIITPDKIRYAESFGGYDRREFDESDIFLTEAAALEKVEILVYREAAHKMSEIRKNNSLHNS